LSQSVNENYIYYGKGPVVFQSIKDQIGQEKLHQALRTLIEMNIAGTEATFDDMVTLILEQTPTRKKALIKRWLTEVFELHLFNKNNTL